MIGLSQLSDWLGEFLPRNRVAPLPLPLPALAPLDEPEPELLPKEAVFWSAPRLDIAEQIWGHGFVLPGGADEILRQIKPMVLTEAETLLLVGAGPFGAARAIHADRKCWVESFERDPDLLRAAQFRAEVAGLRKRAPSSLLEFPPAFRRKSANHALVMQACHDIAEVQPMAAALAEALRGGGQLGWVELVQGDDWSPQQARRWMALERRSSQPPLPQQIGAALKRDFDVRIVEDITKRHMNQVLGGWSDYLERIKRNKPPYATLMLAVNEAEAWLQRMRLVETGRLRLVRWLALRRN